MDSCRVRPARGPTTSSSTPGGFWFTDLGKSDGDRMHMGHLLLKLAFNG
jgi:hypothetical protein